MDGVPNTVAQSRAVKRLAFGRHKHEVLLRIQDLAPHVQVCVHVPGEVVRKWEVRAPPSELAGLVFFVEANNPPGKASSKRA